MNKIELVPGYWISPVIKGGWQLSDGHSLTSKIQSEQAILDTVSFIESGISTLDFGDIYTGVEELIGKAIDTLTQKYGSSARGLVQLHTKYVPNMSALENFEVTDVRKIVDRSLTRLGVEQLDLVQFHWWKYEYHGYLEAMAELFCLKQAGKIRHVSVTNFDLNRLREFVDAGFTPASVQLQYSVLDHRPEGEMAQYCLDHGIGILCYGTVAGGYLSNKFLGVQEPVQDETRSSTKYGLIIEEFGGWEIFQALLNELNKIAIKQNTDISSVASSYILQSPGVKGVIVGARNIHHLDANLNIPNIQFSTEDFSGLGDIFSKSNGPHGPVYDLERYSEKHNRIMHLNNN
jgi:aryl-alcohol dehydrogenase-like predicted oxidoreductase